MTLRTLLCEVRGGNLLPVAKGGNTDPLSGCRQRQKRHEAMCSRFSGLFSYPPTSRSFPKHSNTAEERSYPISVGLSRNLAMIK